ncbi:nuclear transport factor 2 family protein [Ferrovum myxofaciens]|uniref:Nuclear transport factor 2 family protein n=1 Tax=Ferrovum myxofaciens TaxID=416213 RepID=A0A9E6SX19_9PROT|nr:nuclear transport factor 2 family protein [Ferrovum myxofaciens]QKE38975.1 MAG: nuclear transport factor 2 family protein [Ferrovum myxofaciens]QWY74192.1 MAG: nuclear transport factor 2 family protein [Ferrovum myxofaciens]QWY76944.1 MAG: nuclear transport factor 2 family protein [Ferrovum myxofaciens]
MTKHPNIELIERFFAAFSKADMNGIRSVLSEDVRWIIPGHHPLAGTKVGIPEVMAYFEQLAKADFTAEPMFLEANESYVVDVHRVYNRTGKVKLDGVSVLVWKFENEKVVEVQNFPGNQHEWDNFFWEMYSLKPLPDRLKI